MLASCVLTYNYLANKDRIYKEERATLKQATHDAATQINSILRQSIASANSLADGLTNGTVNRKNMLAKLKAMLADDPNYYGGSITFAPFGLDPKVKLYSAYYSRSGANGALEFLQIADIYDYTTPAYDWYVEPMAKGNRWSEPYWDEAGKTYMTTYSAVFYSEEPGTHKKIPNGVVTIDISMNQIKNIIESLSIGSSGFGALTTRNGNYLYHPNYEYVLSHRNLRDDAREKHDSDRLLMADMAARGESGILDHISTITGQDVWLIFETVPISGWSLQNTFIKNDIHINIDMRHRIMWILLALIISGISLAALLLRIDSGSPIRIWQFTAITTILLIIGIGVIWYLTLTYHSSSSVEGIKISDKAVLRTLMNNYQTVSLKKHLPPPIFIPTGLYIDAIEFDGASGLLLTGHLWQKYPNDYPKNFPKGVQFGKAKSVKMEKINTEEVADGEVIQWSFQSALMVDSDYSRYPLEVEHLGIQILPPDPDQNLMLVPDLDAYKLTTPALLPGMDPQVSIPGWKLTESFFLMQEKERNTTFGVGRNFDQSVLPTLYYQIGVKRMFIHAFISNLTPLIVVTIILFAVLMLPKVEIGRILGICVSVFFVVVFSHLNIRKSISGGEIFYLEYFYFVIYLAIIMVPMDSLRRELKIESRFFEYKDGLIAHAIYWPAIMGIFFIITMLKFY